ncbi:MAG: protoporphyrinogen oxidase HemJ [Gammaproteobacteria bacterium]|nr:MAG: protoporphyrinogen oxidase HemJ [Gammaproteobacteria bacterium]RLA10554.1 MAG: protoporphyrinogen oxidase HemJ [Gammaproteobacteria bacterium]RLA17363.1 MAG: protoporphyrinogen oxidase HemJ [Gammaproteobacteria bacterium]
MLWIKAFHLIAVIAWFAGLFYLPRLFVYHATTIDPISIDRFKIMERRLFFGIMTPAAVVALVLGLVMLFDYAWVTYKSMGWLHLKLTLVILLFVYHYYCWIFLKQFRNDQNHHSSKFYRVFNELPTLMLIAIVVATIVKPF